MFGKINRVVKHGVLYGGKGRYTQTCRACGCVYANRRKYVRIDESSLSGKKYLKTTCPECGSLNSKEITEVLNLAQERASE